MRLSLATVKQNFDTESAGTVKAELAGTNEQMRAWEVRKRDRRSKKGAIAVSWAWTEGVDLFDERICITAKTPFPSLGDPYEKARFNFDTKFYLQRTAWALEQSQGRTRRGEKDHYDIGGIKRGLVAIADGNWTRVKSYLSNSFMESII